MPLNEALSLLWFDSLIGSLIVPMHNAYVLTVMTIFPEHYPLFAASVIATTAVMLGVAGNWCVGKIAISITKTSIAEKDEKLNSRLKTKKTKAQQLKDTWNNYGHWTLLAASFIPFFAQGCAIFAGWSGIPLKKLILPSFLGSISFYLAVIFLV